MNQTQRDALLRRIGGQGQANLLNRHLQVMAEFDEVDLYAHNETRLLIDGPAAYASMFQAIEQARGSILLQSYIIEDSAISQRLAAVLKRKKADGVAVAVLYDAVGSIGTPEGFFDDLRASGIFTCAFNPVNPLKRLGYWDITHRDHRKILAVDRQVGFTGGMNISAVYTSGSFGGSRQRRVDDPKRVGWRDTQVRIAGPAVAPLEDLVRATWQQQGCEGPLPPLPQVASGSPRQQATAGGDVVRIVASSPDVDDGRIYAMLLNAIDTASVSIHLTMAYFAPGPDMVDALCDAAARGVAVRLILPSVSDFKPVLYAGQSYYDQLLESGVQLYELDDAVLHAKTAVIDGVVSTVGSSNMDWRSLAANNEVNAVIFGQAFGQAMTRMFEADLARSTRITAERWAERPVWQRTKERLARLWERLW